MRPIHFVRECVCVCARARSQACIRTSSFSSACNLQALFPSLLIPSVLSFVRFSLHFASLFLSCKRARARLVSLILRSRLLYRFIKLFLSFLLSRSLELFSAFSSASALSESPSLSHLCPYHFLPTLVCFFLPFRNSYMYVYTFSECPAPIYIVLCVLVLIDR